MYYSSNSAPAFPRPALQKSTSGTNPLSTVSVTVAKVTSTTTPPVTVEVNVGVSAPKEEIKDNNSKPKPQELSAVEGSVQRETAAKAAVLEVRVEIKAPDVNKDTQIISAPVVEATRPAEIKENQPEPTNKEVSQVTTEAGASKDSKPTETAPTVDTTTSVSNTVSASSATTNPVSTASSSSAAPASVASSSSTTNPVSVASNKPILTRKDGSILKIDPTKPKKFIVFAKRAGTFPRPDEHRAPVKEVKVELVKNELEKYNKQFFTYEELIAKKKPPGVDVTALEKYLPDDEFEKRFEMTKAAFYAIPHWKRTTLRKKLLLY